LRSIFVCRTSPQVEAVEHELLADYVNVVVFSTKGSRSLASLLAGGGSYPPFLQPLAIKLTMNFLATRLDYDGGAFESHLFPSEIYMKQRYGYGKLGAVLSREVQAAKGRRQAR